VNFRYFWGTTLPSLETEVVPLSSVRDALPDDTPVVDAPERADEVAARREHLAWRFRT
jgi:hypothetical protein